MPVYVLGPLAPFSRREVNIRCGQPTETSEVFHLPVERGPATAMPGIPSRCLRSWQTSLGLQFLSQSGRPTRAGQAGLFPSQRYIAVYNDGVITGPSFDPIVLSDYTPGTCLRRSINDWSRHPLRKSRADLRQRCWKRTSRSRRPSSQRAEFGFDSRRVRDIEASYDAMGRVSDALVALVSITQKNHQIVGARTSICCCRAGSGAATADPARCLC